MPAPSLSRVSCTYGATMGRASFGIIENCEPRSVYLFRVRLDSGGYDAGGAYWGCGAPLYWATDGDGYSQFIRAGSRARAALELGFGEHPELLADRSLRKRMAAYASDVLTGRAPPWSGWTREEAIDVMRACGIACG